LQVECLTHSLNLYERINWTNYKFLDFTHLIQFTVDDDGTQKDCKKLGHTIAHSRRNPDYFYKCTKYDVSYSDKEKIHFFKGNHCPCCHLMLRRRKTIAQKNNLV